MRGNLTVAAEKRPAGLVYPRVCGGTIYRQTNMMPHQGLSPRVRGNLGSNTWTGWQVGSIPACAGEPNIGGVALFRHRVYPRVCGGTRCSRDRRGGRGGLSPRVRGNQELAPHNPAIDRSIPACAGEPGTGYDRAGQGKVYPRVCGGTRGGYGDVGGNIGSIPACAGEPWHLKTAEAVGQGLSPRVRGNRNKVGIRLYHKRSIPACAGEPLPVGAGLAVDRVYPRVCGGTHTPTNRAKFPEGLSPRVRGNPPYLPFRPAH